ncbi:MAG: flagellin lysine-N-methylase [Oscillospiraceae bacterium]|nr:flagellin lysine-N-methylase [Oscillospiraceae bacterium]
MRFTTPDYYDEFRCIAGDCRDSCCIGWEIDIDADTLGFYEQVPGSFGQRLHDNIQDGCFRLDAQERCPFLNRAGLCDIYTQLGEEHLCQICTDHPRFFSWFGDRKEGGIGLCCEAAANLILTRPLRLVTREIPDDFGEECDPALLDLLMLARSQMLERILHEGTLSDAVASLLRFAQTLQFHMDNGIRELPAWEAAPSGRFDADGMLAFLQTLEPMDPTWHETLSDLRCHLSDLPPLEPKEAEMLRNIGNYFLFRYFLAGVFEGEILSRVKLAAAAMQVIGLLWRYRRIQGEIADLTALVDLAKAFSKEIEYSEENLNAMLDAAYEVPAFSDASLSGFPSRHKNG